VEQRGIDKTKEAIAKADLLVLVTDAAAGDAPLEVLPEPESTGVANIPTIVVRNKIDLTGEAAVVTRDDGKPTVSISAKTGAGVDLLKQEILRQAGWDFGAEGLFLARERHLRALNGAQSHLAAAGEILRDAELVAEELRLAHQALAGITGEFTSDDLLGEIFSRFCIGK